MAQKRPELTDTCSSTPPCRVGLAAPIKRMISPGWIRSLCSHTGLRLFAPTCTYSDPPFSVRCPVSSETARRNNPAADLREV